MEESLIPIYSVLQDMLGKKVENDFKNFVNKHRSSIGWLIASDYVIEAVNRCNNTYAFTVIPSSIAIQNRKMREFSKADLKDTKQVESDLLDFLKSDDIFTFCFTLNSSDRVYPNRKAVLEEIDRSINLMKEWEDAPGKDYYIKSFKQLRTRAQAQNFKVKLLSNIYLATDFAALISCLIAKFTVPHVVLKNPKTIPVGWFSDRDNITTSYQSIAFDMFMLKFQQFSHIAQIPNKHIKILIGAPDPLQNKSNELWFDNLVRLPDHIAGVVANWNFDKNTMCSGGLKYDQLREQVIAGNTNLHIIRIKISNSEISASRLQVSAKP